MSPEPFRRERERARPGRAGRGLGLTRKAFGYLVLSIIGVVMALPFIWMVLTSFKDRGEVEKPNFVPTTWHPENYGVILKLAKDPSTVGKDRLTLFDGEEIVGVDRVNFRAVPAATTQPSTATQPRALAVSTTRPASLEGRLVRETDREVVIRTGAGVVTTRRANVDSVDIGGGKYLPIDFGKWYFNSFFVACWVTVLQVLTAAMAAYAFSRISWRGRDKVFLLYLGTMMIPGLVLMIPNFQIIVKLGLYNSYAGLIIPGACTTFGTFLLRQFMLSIPRSLDEAAQVDGASHWTIFWEVIMPLARPGLVIIAIFTFIGSFQSFFWPLVVLRDEWLYTLPVGMLFFDNSQQKATELIMAATVINILPMMLLFIVLQKYLVKGIQLGAGGVKG